MRDRNINMLRAPFQRVVMGVRPGIGGKAFRVRGGISTRGFQWRVGGGSIARPPYATKSLSRTVAKFLWRADDLDHPVPCRVRPARCGVLPAVDYNSAATATTKAEGCP